MSSAENTIVILTEEDAQRLTKIAHIAELVRVARQGGRRLSEVSPKAQRFIAGRLDELRRSFEAEAVEETGDALDHSRAHVAAS